MINLVIVDDSAHGQVDRNTIETASMIITTRGNFIKCRFDRSEPRIQALSAAVRGASEKFGGALNLTRNGGTFAMCIKGQTLESLLDAVNSIGDRCGN